MIDHYPLIFGFLIGLLVWLLFLAIGFLLSEEQNPQSDRNRQRQAEKDRWAESGEDEEHG